MERIKLEPKNTIKWNQHVPTFELQGNDRVIVCPHVVSFFPDFAIIITGGNGDFVTRQLALELQLFTASMMKSLLRPERNQQILCDSGLPHELLSHASAALTDETHPLHPPLQHMFERLASQSLTPRDLRWADWQIRRPALCTIFPSILFKVFSLKVILNWCYSYQDNRICQQVPATTKNKTESMKGWPKATASRDFGWANWQVRQLDVSCLMD